VLEFAAVLARLTPSRYDDTAIDALRKKLDDKQQ
jgi:hypothetical protein